MCVCLCVLLKSRTRKLKKKQFNSSNRYTNKIKSYNKDHPKFVI